MSSAYFVCEFGDAFAGSVGGNALQLTRVT